MAEQEEKAAEVTRAGVAEFAFHVLRADVGQLRAEIARLADRQDAQLKVLLERQDQMYAKLDEKLNRKIDPLYRAVIVVLVTTLGSLITGIISLVVH